MIGCNGHSVSQILEWFHFPGMRTEGSWTPLEEILDKTCKVAWSFLPHQSLTHVPKLHIACRSWVQGASREMFWLAIRGALSHKTSGLNVHCHLQTLWLGGKIIFLGSRFSSCQLVLPCNKEEHFYLQRQITLLVFWDSKENAIFLKRVGNNFFLSINCLPCVCLGPINYVREHKMWSSIAQNWHYCWKDQAYRSEGVITLNWGYTAILS